MTDDTQAPAEQGDVASAVRAAIEFKAEARNKLIAALAKAKLKFGKIEKNREARVTFGYDHARAGQLAYTFRYADLAEINDKTEGALAGEGLVIVHQMVRQGEVEFIKTSLLHAEGGCLENLTRMIQTDKGQAGYAKAQTFAQRYGVKLVLNLAAEDDDDAEPENTEARDVVRGTNRATGLAPGGDEVPVDVEEMDEYAKRITAALDNADPKGAALLFDELKPHEKSYVMRNGGFTDRQKNILYPGRTAASPDPERPNRRGRA